MEKQVCIICGYIYDPKTHDPDNVVFSDGWVCPDCGTREDNMCDQE